MVTGNKFIVKIKLVIIVELVDFKGLDFFWFFIIILREIFR